MKHRNVLVVSATVFACLAIGVGATAWACTEFTSLQAPKQAPVGSVIEVRASGKAAPNKDLEKQVEVRWNDVTGPVVAEATAGQIATGTGTQMTIPEVSPGVYFLLAVVDGKAMTRTSIEVTAADGSPSAAPTDFRPLKPRSTNDSALQVDSATPQFLGVALLAGGMVLLSAGAVVTLTRRGRKVPVATASSEHLDLST